MQSEPPDIPNLGGPIPDAWNALIKKISEVEPDSRARSELDARLQVWLLFTDLRARQVEATAANRLARAVSIGTWVLAIATLGLCVATIVLAVRTP